MLLTASWGGDPCMPAAVLLSLCADFVVDDAQGNVLYQKACADTWKLRLSSWTRHQLVLLCAWIQQDKLRSFVAQWQEHWYTKDCMKLNPRVCQRWVLFKCETQKACSPPSLAQQTQWRCNIPSAPYTGNLLKLRPSHTHTNQFPPCLSTCNLDSGEWNSNADALMESMFLSTTWQTHSRRTWREKFEFLWRDQLCEWKHCISEKTCRPPSHDCLSPWIQFFSPHTCTTLVASPILGNSWDVCLKSAAWSLSRVGRWPGTHAPRNTRCIMRPGNAHELNLKSSFVTSAARRALLPFSARTSPKVTHNCWCVIDQGPTIQCEESMNAWHIETKPLTSNARKTLYVLSYT